MKAEDFWPGGLVMADPLRGGNGNDPLSFLNMSPTVNRGEYRGKREQRGLLQQLPSGGRQKENDNRGVWVSSCVVKEWEKTEGAAALGSPETTNKHLWWGCFVAPQRQAKKKGVIILLQSIIKISVDRWAEGSQVYFLTHLHADHTDGLSSRWKKGPLFCSSITAKLFSPKFPSFDLSLLRVLEIGQWYSLSLVSLWFSMETRVEVIAIDANHCPGAVMYLFRGDFGNMLYTCDFRWKVSSKISEMGKNMLLSALNNHKVDTLYIDNTYCNPSYSFPSREVAAQ
uniref:Metallo-beta-lactamase domain-containing protein n=1 Tax=Lactuca sativa TaxID=4236 RepID=A0A9R1W4L4_LACSA|nr:hypothetical protein LSAT_V11C300133400 [Lactuca sativa]